MMNRGYCDEVNVLLGIKVSLHFCCFDRIIVIDRVVVIDTGDTE